MTATTPAARMVAALLGCTEVADPVARGRLLAAAGLAVFPVPMAHDQATCPSCRPLAADRVCHGKHDQGAGAYGWADATLDPDTFAVMAADVLRRHRTAPGVNIAIAPGLCAVACTVLDLDGPAAVEAFRTAAQVHKLPDGWLLVRTCGRGGGWHVWVVTPEPRTGAHPFGGETRGASGHVMAPGSVVDGRADYYTCEGSWLLTAALHPWLVDRLRVGSGEPGRPAARAADVESFLAEHRATWPSPRALALVRGLADWVRQAVPGDPDQGRHPRCVAALARVVSLIRGGADLDAEEAVALIRTAFLEVAPDRHGGFDACLAWAVGNAKPEPMPDDPDDLSWMADQTAAGPPPNPEVPEPEPAELSPFERAVRREAFDLRVRQEARRRVAELAEPQPFDAALLDDVADEPVRWRVDGLLPTGGRLLLAAQRKAGKTTATLNLARDLLLGGAYLGRFDVAPVAGRVAFLNLEVSRAQLARWAREAGVPGDRLLTVHLRGRRSPFGDDDDAARLADLLAEHAVEVAVVDPFGRAYTGKSQNDAGEVGAWLAALDRFADAAGLRELVLCAHAGWDGERTRGSTALEDWADAVAYLVRDRDDETVRYFRALGRDVEVDEDRLDFDPATRRLTLAGAGSRSTARATRRAADLADAVVDVVTAEPGATVARLEELLREAGHGIQRGEASKAARAAADAGRVDRVAGPRNSVRHYPKGHAIRVVPSTPDPSRRDVGSTPDPSYMGREYSGTTREPTLPGSTDPDPPPDEPSSVPTHGCAGPACRVPGCQPTGVPS